MRISEEVLWVSACIGIILLIIMSAVGLNIRHKKFLEKRLHVSYDKITFVVFSTNNTGYSRVYEVNGTEYIVKGIINMDVYKGDYNIDTDVAP